MKTIFTALICVTILSACATAPKPTELDNLAKIRFGEEIPENQDYILYFEAGQKVPMTILIDGDLIDQGVDQQATVTLNKAIYAYKEWASFDGINWIRGDKFMDLSLTLTLPGYDNPNPGVMHLKLDEKKQ